jgi:hypothetical protein
MILLKDEGFIRDRTVDPATSIEFPKTIKIGAKVPIPPLSLVGVGVRTVSFLGIKVYSVGFYADLNNPNLKVCFLDQVHHDSFSDTLAPDNFDHDRGGEDYTHSAEYTLSPSNR